MADIKQIQFKRSVTAGKKPAAADLVEGELAINLTDRTIFTKDRQGQVVDLGFAKGGRVDGDITQVGSYTQTGNFNQTGNFTTTGDVSAKTLLVSSGVESQGDIRANSGVIRTRANAASNAHVWFEGIEVGSAKNFERGVLYAPPQQANAGAINLRVLNGTATDAGQALFSWRGDGDFNIPRDFLGQRARLAIEAVAPTMNASRLYTRDRAWNQFGANESYGWNDIVNWTPAENGPLALNYVYKGRAMASGTIWHQLLDERVTPEWSLYTGAGPSQKMFSVFSQGGNGHGRFSGSMMIGGGINDISELNDNSIALGEKNTGIRRTSTGNLDMISSGGMQFRMSAPTSSNISYKRLWIQHSDANGNAINPAGNNAQLQIDTSGDGNNTGGNGLTLIGYYTTGGEYYHYFRGKGEAAFSMGKGVRIDQGGLTVNGNSTFTNALNVGGTVSSSRFDALGDLAFKNTGPRHIRWEYINSGGATAVDGYIYKDGPSSSVRRPGIRVNCSAPNGDSSGEFVFGEDGNFTVPKNISPGSYSNFDARYQNLFQLGANVNLDTLTQDSQIGEWAQHANANTSLALNYPEALAGHLTVTSGAGVQQRYHVYNSTRVYLRAKYSSEAWKPWDRVITEDYITSGVAAPFVSRDPSQNQFRAVSNNGAYGFFIRNDGGSTYFMLTNQNDPMGSWNGLRPLTISNANGNVSIGHTLTVGGGTIEWGTATAPRAALANDGNIRGTRWAAFGGSTWAGDALAWVNNQNVSLTGNVTKTGQLVINQDGAAMRLNSTSNTTKQVYLLFSRANDNIFYLGNPTDGSNDTYWHNYKHNTQVILRSGDIYCSRTVYGNGDANFNNVYIRSDITLKRNFKTIENALDKVDKLEGLIYEKKNSRESTEYETTEAGIIAQSLQAVLPEAVAEHEGVLNVSASGTIALLVNAIKELKARVEYLESK